MRVEKTPNPQRLSRFGEPINERRVVCANCNLAITRDGIVILPYERVGTVQFFHKGRCDPGTPGWVDLPLFLEGLLETLSAGQP